ncbi:hypothetical protein V2J09_014538 [Rumex salicifolius]
MGQSKEESAETEVPTDGPVTPAEEAEENEPPEFSSSQNQSVDEVEEVQTEEEVQPANSLSGGRIRNRPNWHDSYEMGNITVELSDHSERLVKKFKSSMQAMFEMTDLGRMKYFLGVEVNQSARGVFISQKKYVRELLAKFGLLGSNPVTLY